MDHLRPDYYHELQDTGDRTTDSCLTQGLADPGANLEFDFWAWTDCGFKLGSGRGTNGNCDWQMSHELCDTSLAASVWIT